MRKLNYGMPKWYDRFVLVIYHARGIRASRIISNAFEYRVRVKPVKLNEFTRGIVNQRELQGPK